MSRSVKIVLYGLLGGMVSAIALHYHNPNLTFAAGAFILGFLVIGLLAIFVIKEKAA
jgi:hypothetical protein